MFYVIMIHSAIGNIPVLSNFPSQIQEYVKEG